MPSLLTSLLSIDIAILLIILASMFFLSSKNNFPVDGRTIIITGASQGLGLSAAQKLAAKGANIVIVARDVAKLERAIELLRASALRPSQKFMHLSYDLTKPESATTILSDVVSWNNGQPPDIVWCCAGLSHPSFFADASISTLHAQMDSVYWSCAYMAHATLNVWKTPSLSSKPPSSDLPARHFIFTSSALAFFPVAGYTPYTPAKAAMRALADSLNQEVAVYNGARLRQDTNSPGADMKIHIIFPMGIQSPGFDNENAIKPELTLLLEKDDVPQPPDDVAISAIQSLENGEFLISTLFLGHLMKGCAMGASVRSGIMDYFWNWLGSIVVLFVTPDFLAKCRKWGIEKGMHTGPKET